MIPKLFVVHVYLCVMGQTPETIGNTCEHHEGVEEGNGLPLECFMKAQVLASKYIRADYRVYKLGCLPKK